MSVVLHLVLVWFALVVAAAQVNVDVVGCVVLLGFLWVLLKEFCSGSWLCCFRPWGIVSREWLGQDGLVCTGVVVDNVDLAHGRVLECLCLGVVGCREFEWMGLLGGYYHVWCCCSLV